MSISEVRIFPVFNTLIAVGDFSVLILRAYFHFYPF